MNYHFQRYGNFIGNYFDDISCAKEAGLHYVAVLRKFDKEPDKRAFWEALPTLLPHPDPAMSYQAAALRVRDRCKCQRYCWNYDDPVMRNIPFVGNLLRQSVYHHLRQEDPNGSQLLNRPWAVTEGVDLFPPDLQASLSLIPGLQCVDCYIFYIIVR